MIFAAGLGKRLGELGRDTPKALIAIAGQTMLERTARALVVAGAERIVVNLHHHAEAIERYLAAHDLGAEMLVSREPDHPLETGGGLLHARALFRRDGPLLLHNVDVITEADLRALVAAHRAGAALATLAVSERETQRYLLFDDDGLCGREDLRSGARTECRAPRGAVRRRAFSGIHVCSPEMLDRISERGVFPIVDVYLRLAREGARIADWTLPGRWLEIGTAKRLAEVRKAMEGPVS